jgi:predicted AAA+ superfamily ATPase
MKRIKRFQYEALIQELERPEISILLGPRQVGKTFLLKELYSLAQQQQKRVAYYNLEIPSDSILFNQSDENLFTLLTHNVDVVFIDEFHYLKNAAKLFKAIFDSQKQVKLVVSGSSSIEIHKHIKESLAGRRLVTQIGPLTLSEFSQLYTQNTSENKIFSDYLTYGGLPGVIHEKDEKGKMRLLNDIFATYIQKDIKSLIKEENIRAFNQLLYLLADYQGQLISMNSLSRDIGVSTATVSHYLSLLEATYVLYPVHSYAKNLSNELKKSKKYYFYDSGIRNAILNDFSNNDRPDIGSIHESFVLQALMRYKSLNSEIRFWRTKQGNEIDFIVLKNRKPSLIEVKSTLKSPVEPKAFDIFESAYPPIIGRYVVSKTLINNSPEKNTTFLPFYDFETLVKQTF